MHSKNGLFESAFNYAPIGMAMVSLDQKCLKVNHSLCQLLNYEESELLGKSVEQFTHAEDYCHNSRMLHDMIEGKIIQATVEKRYLKKDGGFFWGLLNVSISKNAEGIPQYFVAHVMDITEQKYAQTSLIQNSKMIALGEMAGAIVHEINNPLAIIGLNASSICEALKDDVINRDDMKKFLKKINDTVMRINDIVSGLRKLAGNSANVSVSSHDVRSLIQDALSLCHERFKATEVELELIIDDFDIDCKLVEISQVLINLLNNAFYAIKTAEKKKITIRSYIEENFGVIEVTDTGPEISPETRQKMKQPFYTSKPPGVGTGLGLSICRKIVESHKGIFFLSDKPETTFTLKLPLK